MKRFVVEISPTVSADGSTATFLFSTTGWRTRPTDTPPGVPVRALLKNPGNLRRELFTRARVTGAITPGFGNIVLNNKAPARGGVGPFDDWIDYGIAGSRVVVRWGDEADAYPAGYAIVFIASAAGWVADVDELTIRLQDQLSLLDQPVAAEGFAGTGLLEGTPGIAKRKQFVSGDPGFITPVLIDAVRQIYHVDTTATGGQHDLWQVNTGTPINPFDVFANAVEITRTSPNYSSAAELQATAPAPGYVRHFFGDVSALLAGWRDGGVYFRLGTPPVNEDVRVYPVGYPQDADHARLGVTWGTFTAQHIAARAGILAANIDLSGFALPVGPQFVGDDRTYADLLDDSALALQGWYGINRLGVFRSGFLLDPNSEHIYYGVSPTIASVASIPSTSVHTFKEEAIRDLTRQPVPGMEAPVTQVSMQAGDTQPSRIAGGASDTMRDYLSREVWHSSTARVAAVKLADPGALNETVRMRGRFIQSDLDRDLWYGRYFALYGGRRHFFTFKVNMTPELLDLDLHDCVTLEHSRFGLDAGVKCRIVSITISCVPAEGKPPEMEFKLWTGDTATYVPIPGGGGGPPPAAVNPLAQQQLIAPFTQVFFASVASAAAGGGSGALMGDFTQQFIASVAGDGSFSSVLALLHFEGSDGDTTTTDSSSYGHTVTLDNTAIETTGALLGASSLLCAGSASGQYATYDVGANVLNSSEFTYDIQIDAEASQNQSYPLLFSIGPSFGGNAIQVYLSHAAYPGKITVWVYNYSAVAPLLTGTIDLRGAGRTHVSLQRSVNTWSLHVGGVLDASATYSGSGSNLSGRFIGGAPGASNVSFEGLIDEFRETLGVARYPAAGNYTPSSTPFPNG